MALFEFSKTENHFHGEAPKLMVNGDSNDVRGNIIKAAADPPKTGFEIFKIVLTQVLAALGTLLVAYLVYLFGFANGPTPVECHFPNLHSPNTLESEKPISATKLEETYK